MKPVIWGVIGCGEVCEKKVGPALAGVEGSQLAAVMRRTASLAEDFAQRHHVPRWYDTIDGLLGDPDINAVYVSTPNGAHEEPVFEAARAAKHVIVEKDMASNADNAQRMIDLCRDMNVTLAVAYYRRCYPAVMRAKQLLDEGVIGQPVRIDIADRFPLSHQLDLVHYFAGEIEAVRADEQKLPEGSHAEAGPVIHIRTRNGVTGTMAVDYRWKQPQTVTIAGTKGEIAVEDIMGGELRVTVDSRETRESFGKTPATHWGLIENFVAHLNGRAPLACDGVEGRKSQVLLDLVDTLDRDGSEAIVVY